MERPSWAPIEVDMSRPSVARVYDYYLGGSHNFESDRAFAQQVLQVYPALTTITRDNRDFLRRVVLHLTEQGIDQFLDLGSGIPTAGNVHEIAQLGNPEARILYVDHDPVAITHSRKLLAGNDRVLAIHGDLREPQRVLADVAALGHLDLSRPVAVLMVAVLHFVADEQGPADIVAAYMTATAPGSYFALSHARTDGQQQAADVEQVYNRSRSPNPMRFRSTSEIRALFGALELVEPGLTLIPRWRPDSGDDLDGGVADDYPGLAGVGKRV